MQTNDLPRIATTWCAGGLPAQAGHFQYFYWNGCLASILAGRLCSDCDYSPFGDDTRIKHFIDDCPFWRLGYWWNASAQLSEKRESQQGLAFTWTYGYYAAGRLSGIVSPGGVSLAYGYDGALPVSMTQGGPVAGTLSADYDNFFRIAAIGVNGNKIAYGYDADGLLVAAGNLTLSRDAANGRLTGTTLGQVGTALAYDGYGDIARLTARQGNTVLYDEQVERDTLGRPVVKTIVLGGNTQTWR